MPGMGLAPAVRNGVGVSDAFKPNVDRRDPSAMSVFRMRPSPNWQQSASLGWAPASTVERRDGTPGRRRKVEARPDRNDAGRIDRAVAAVIVGLDVVEAHRLGDARHLIERARKIPQLGKIHQAVTVAFEMAMVDRIEAHQSSEQPPVRFGDLLAEEEWLSVQPVLQPVEHREQLAKRLLIGGL